jgi:hypothetical protein
MKIYDACCQGAFLQGGLMMEEAPEVFTSKIELNSQSLRGLP